MQEIFEKICNRFKESDDATITIMGGYEFGGTYDRPWTSHKYKHLNDRGETVQHGR